MITRRTLASLLAATALPLGARAQTHNPDPDRLRVALLPDESPTTVVANNRALEAYLAGVLGKPIELIVTTDYSSMIEAMRFGRIELGYFGGFSYILAKTRAPDIEAFAVQIQNGRPTYNSVIIANAATDIHSLADIRGKQFVFGDPASTSSHLIPRSMLLDAGLTEEIDYKFAHVGTHDSVARTVQGGRADAGGLSKPIFESLLARKSIDLDHIRVVAESVPIPNYPWTMQGYLAPALRDRIRNAFLELKDTAVLAPFKVDGFGPITDADYDIYRQTARKLNLDLSKSKG